MSAKDGPICSGCSGEYPYWEPHRCAWVNDPGRCSDCTHILDSDGSCPVCKLRSRVAFNDPSPPKTDGRYETIGTDIGALVDAKQLQYGNSFGKAGQFLRLLYPNGIPVGSYDAALALVRIFDKQMRVATDNDPTGESPWSDIAGYALLALGSKEKK